ncbi:DEAD/DEAH box helicase [Terracoccus luteus]|uniref:Superfamily II DNA or RNA helicase n=1 Tax=Terracoccus luteus TaxID=53356 RepID=A0A839Q483_9MICO|nr:DEAD/DEAH box helicase [Terracoccus luteus]MBB2987952.1 superfamily II DNA or RNA helicase [Terracoccus luteus]MCP2173603.1 superfamily II DNA or RNA helicase [Terracoccus luteus]
MAWSVGRATWVGDLSDSSIEQQVGSRTFERGQAYAAQRRVRSIASRPEGRMLLGTVSGSRSDTYQVIVESTSAERRARGIDWWARCSCPVASDCKHAVALLLTARDVAQGVDPSLDPSADAAAEAGAGAAAGPGATDAGGTSAAGDAAALGGADAGARARRPASTVHWSDVLGHVRPRATTSQPTLPVPQPRGDLMPGALYVDTIYRAPGGLRDQADLSYGLRPTRLTRTGAWHQSLSWHEALPQWRAGIRLLPEHERLFTRLRDAARHGSGGTTYFTQSPPLALDASAEVWPLLREAREAGVELLPGHGVAGPVTVADEPATLSMALLRADDGSGDLVVRLDVELPPGLGALDEGQGPRSDELVALGDPVHALALEREAGDVVFVPVEQQLGLDPRAFTQALAGLRVPAGERATFLRTTVPGLRERVRLRSDVPLPVSQTPAGGADGAGGEADAETGGAAVTVHVRIAADVPGEVRLDLGYAYDGEARRFSTARFGGGDRDRAAEAAAVAGATSVQAVPGATRTDASGGVHLVSQVVLTGIRATTFVAEHLSAMEDDEHVTVEFDGVFPAYDEVTSAPVVRLGVGADDVPVPGVGGRGDRDPDAERTDWFDLHVSVEVEGEEVPFEPLFAALARGDEIMLLESGTWFRLDRPELTRLRSLIGEAREIADPDSTELRLSPHHADLWDELVSLGVVDRQSARWAATVEALDGTAPEQPVVPDTVRPTLRPYQLDGFRWLSRLWDARLGGILADDMGLGKTLQVIATLARAHERGDLGGDRGPVLVVAPTSVVGTWVSELAMFAPHLSVATLAATSRKRGTTIEDAVAGAEVVITSYAVLRLDDAQFQSLPWSGVVLDEAQFVKNRQAKTHIAARKLDVPFTLAVTGTPLENSLMDLWSLLSLTAPGLYPRPDQFTKNYRRPIESGERPELLDLLRRRIRPLMLRRTKAQVALDLPPKQVQVMPVALHPVHQHVYDQHLQRERQRVLGLLEDPDANRVAILASLTRLRQLALDPALVSETYAGRATAAKVELLVDHLRELAAEGHRALVFSQFTGFLAVVARALDAAGIRHAYLDGSTTDRQRVVEEFKGGDAPAFLISLKAGGFGLTLTEADYVFVLDPWWNPAAESQAIDRTHRIGQSRPVTVYRLVSAGTIEEKVVALQERKRDLFERVVDEGGSLSGAITAADVRDLLGLP